MPFKSPTWQRYKPTVAFVAVVVTFVLGLAALKVAVNGSNHAAHQAQALAVQVKRQQVQIRAENERRRKLRARQIADLEVIAAKSCHDRHVMNHVLAGLLSTNRTLVKRAKPFPGLTAGQNAELARRDHQYVALLDTELKRLKRADCVPPPTPKVPTG